MKADTFARLVSTSLYEHRFGPFFVTPIVVGLDDGEPIIYHYDSIGSAANTTGYTCAGTASANYFALCESYYKENLEVQELTDIVSNVLVSGCDRDILSGWGGIVYVLTEESINAKYLKTKMI